VLLPEPGNPETTMSFCDVIGLLQSSGRKGYSPGVCALIASA
jgi:hypothetical protein